MATPLFLSSIPGDASPVIEADSQIADLGPENLFLPEPYSLYRANGNTCRIIIQLSSALACTGAAIVNHNGTATGEWQVMGGGSRDAVNDLDTPIVDTGMQSFWKASGKPDHGLPFLSSLAQWENSTALSWWSFTIDDSDNADNWEAGRLMIDLAMRPLVKPGTEIAMQGNTKDDVRVSDFNRVTLDPRGPTTRKLIIPWKAIDKEDFRKYFMGYQLRHGLAKDFYFSVNPDYDEDFCLWSGQFTFGEMTAFQRQMQFRPSGGVYTCNMSFLESS